MAGLATWDRLGHQQRGRSTRFKECSDHHINCVTELYEASLLRVETLEAQMKELQHEVS